MSIMILVLSFLPISSIGILVRFPYLTSPKELSQNVMGILGNTWMDSMSIYLMELKPLNRRFTSLMLPGHAYPTNLMWFLNALHSPISVGLNNVIKGQTWKIQL